VNAGSYRGARARWVVIALLAPAWAGCASCNYRVDVLDRATGEAVLAVVEVAQVDASNPPRELYWTRDVWVGPDRPARISLWGCVPYRVTLFEQPALGTSFPDRDEWPVLARWPRPLRPGEDADRWYVSDDGRFQLRLRKG